MAWSRKLLLRVGRGCESTGTEGRLNTLINVCYSSLTSHERKWKQRQLIPRAVPLLRSHQLLPLVRKLPPFNEHHGHCRAQRSPGKNTPEQNISTSKQVSALLYRHLWILFITTAITPQYLTHSRKKTLKSYRLNRKTVTSVIDAPNRIKDSVYSHPTTHTFITGSTSRTKCMSLLCHSPLREHVTRDPW